MLSFIASKSLIFFTAHKPGEPKFGSNILLKLYTKSVAFTVRVKFSPKLFDS